MTTPYIGEVQIFGFNYAPVDWAQCNGASMPISQYNVLYALIGTTYGGDGRTFFQLPNFAVRAACGQGNGIGLTPRSVGDTFGTNQVTLTTDQIPSHNHGGLNIYRQTNTALQSNTPGNGYGLIGPLHTLPFVSNPTANTTFSVTSIGNAGSGQAHENRQPFLAVNFCIALQGVFPAFN